MVVGPIWLLIFIIFATALLLPFYGLSRLKKEPRKGKLMLLLWLPIAFYTAINIYQMLTPGGYRPAWFRFF
jgi:hypothetical protein